MKGVIIASGFLLSFLVGVVSTAGYYESKLANINETIISREIELLSSVPSDGLPCDKLLRANDWVIERMGEFTVFWRYDSDRSKATKLIVGDELASAAEAFSTSCLK